MEGTSVDNETRTGTITVIPFNSWGSSANYDRSGSASSDWITVPVTDASTTKICVYVYYCQFSSQGTDMWGYDRTPNVEAKWTDIPIPKY